MAEAEVNKVEEARDSAMVVDIMAKVVSMRFQRRRDNIVCSGTTGSNLVDKHLGASRAFTLWRTRHYRRLCTLQAKGDAEHVQTFGSWRSRWYHGNTYGELVEHDQLGAVRLDDDGWNDRVKVAYGKVDRQSRKMSSKSCGPREASDEGDMNNIAKDYTDIVKAEEKDMASREKTAKEETEKRISDSYDAFKGFEMSTELYLLVAWELKSGDNWEPKADKEDCGVMRPPNLGEVRRPKKKGNATFASHQRCQSKCCARSHSVKSPDIHI